MEDISAVYICRDKVRIPLQRPREVLPCLLQVSIVFMHIAGKQGQIGFLWQHIAILGGQRQQFVVALLVEQVVAQVNDHVPVLGQHLDRFFADRCRLPVIALEAQVPLLFAEHLGLILHRFGRAACPHPCQVQLVGLNRRIHSAGHNSGILRSQLVRLAVVGLGLRKLAARRVQIA